MRGAAWVILTAPCAAAWSAGGAWARPCPRAPPRAPAPASQVVDAGADPDASPRFVWGEVEETESVASSGSLMELSASYGWCLDPSEQAELEAYEAQLTNATNAYMPDADLARLKLALEITYQSRWRPAAHAPRTPPARPAPTAPRRLAGIGPSRRAQTRGCTTRWPSRSSWPSCAWRSSCLPLIESGTAHGVGMHGPPSPAVSGERRLGRSPRRRLRGHRHHALAGMISA